MRAPIALSAVLTVALATAPATALACGGCFAPPGAAQVVTDHRMVLSLSADRTVLWDQFRYSGRPTDFSWILPIQNGPDVRVEVADNRFITALDNLSAPALTVPIRRCYASARSGSSSTRAILPAPQEPEVMVLQEAVVGPYMTAVVRSDDPTALRTWLRSNGYAVPAQIEPVLDFYVSQRMDFVALRLRMGEGVEQMTPIRVSTPGLHPTLPLRMVAAGVADKVGLLLMVVAAARYEAMNFPNGQVDPSALVYDFNTPTTPADDFRRAADALNRERGGRMWLTESAAPVARTTVERGVQTLANLTMPGGPAVAADDAEVAFRGVGQTATLTRLRADLSPDALDRDLQLMASDLGVRSRTYEYGTVRNQPPPCGVDDDPAVDFRGCGVARGAGGAGWALLLAGLALARRRRRS